MMEGVLGAHAYGMVCSLEVCEVMQCSTAQHGTVCTQRGQAFIVNDLPVAKRDDVREL